MLKFLLPTIIHSGSDLIRSGLLPKYCIVLVILNSILEIWFL